MEDVSYHHCTALQCSAFFLSLCTLSLVNSKLPARSEGNGGCVDSLPPAKTTPHPCPIHFGICITLLHLPAYHKDIAHVFSSFRSGLLPSCDGVDTLIKASEQLGTSTWIPQRLHIHAISYSSIGILYSSSSWS
jgi:hypothetical protein